MLRIRVPILIIINITEKTEGGNYMSKIIVLYQTNGLLTLATILLIICLTVLISNVIRYKRIMKIHLRAKRVIKNIYKSNGYCGLKVN